MEIFAIGIDIGGTKTNFAAMDQLGTLVYSQKLVSKEIFGLKPDPVDCMGIAINQFCQDHDINLSALRGVVVGVPGKIDPYSQTITSVPNLKILEGVTLAGPLSQNLNLPVAVENDVNLIALGEQFKGAGKGYDNFACVYVGTGIGGGLILNGRLFVGADGAAGELGHMPIVPEGLLCTCGTQGCLEMYCSGKALARQATTILAEEGLVTNPSTDDENWDMAAQVFQAARKGNQKAVAAINNAFYYLGLGVIQLATIVNPRLVLLGGGILNAWPQGLAIVEQTVRKSASVPYKDTLVVKLAALKDEASFAGAFAIISQILK